MKIPFLAILDRGLCTMSDHRFSDKRVTRRSILRTGVALGAAATFSDSVWAGLPSITAEMAKAALAWLNGVSEAQRSEAQFAWTSPQLTDWHYVPRTRPGIALRDMTDAQTAAAWDLLATLLSARGLDRLRGNLKVEKILGELENRPHYRDPGNYALVFFGDPAANSPWAWRFEGHHVSLNVVVVPDYGLSVTPVFFGSNPGRVPDGHQHGGFRLLGKEEDAAFGLVRSLEGVARERVLISDQTFDDILAGPGREQSLTSYQGSPIADFNEAQQDGIMTILQLFAGTMRDEIAGSVMKKLQEAGLASLHFAWAGALEPGNPHYFRIHGPNTLIEYDNTQNDANHVHSLWIDPKNIFGGDWLKGHYEKSH